MAKGYVITAGPCSGKTSVIDELASRGYDTIRETARDVIDFQQQKEQGILPWTDLPAFQTLVITEQFRREAPFEGRTYFADRGIFDGEAYLAEQNILTPNWMRAIYEENLDRYNKIFLLDPLSNYQKDDQRIESPERGIALTDYIGNTYRKYGFDVINVPVFEGEKKDSIRKRADFILERIV